MGEHSEYGHRLVGRYAIDNTDLLVAIGKDAIFMCDEAKSLGFDESNIYYFNTKEEAIENIDTIIKEDDVVLVKASRGMQLEKIVEYLNK